MKDGATRWSTATTAPCQDMGVVGGRGLIVREYCWNGEPGSAGAWRDITYRLRKLDLATGAALWTYTAAEGIRSLHVPSVAPTVVAVSAGDTGITDLISSTTRATTVPPSVSATAPTSPNAQTPNIS